jgi:hypothetical protein
LDFGFLGAAGFAAAKAAVGDDAQHRVRVVRARCQHWLCQRAGELLTLSHAGADPIVTNTAQRLPWQRGRSHARLWTPTNASQLPQATSSTAVRFAKQGASTKGNGRVPFP